MKYIRMLLAVAFVSVLVSACSSPTIPYPQPRDEGGDPNPPNPGISVYR